MNNNTNKNYNKQIFIQHKALQRRANLAKYKRCPRVIKVKQSNHKVTVIKTF